MLSNAASILRGLVLGQHEQKESKQTTQSLPVYAKPKPVDAKDYPLFQLQQAFEEKVFDAKKVMTILRDEKFTAACPSIYQTELLPIWVNLMGSTHPQFAELLLLLQAYEQDKETNFPANLSEAKDAKSIIESYRNALFTRELKKFPVKKLFDNILSTSFYKVKFDHYIFTGESIYDSPYDSPDQLIAEVKKIGKKDLTTKYYFKRDKRLCDLAPEEKISISQLLIFEKNQWMVKTTPKLAGNLQAVLNAIELQPNEVLFNLDDLAYNRDEVSATIQVEARRIRDQSLLQAFDVCMSCFEHTKWLFPVTEESIKATMTQLILAIGHDNFLLYLKSKAKQKFIPDSYQPEEDDLYNYGRLTWNKKLLQAGIEAMQAAGLNTIELLNKALDTLLSRLKKEKEKSQVDLLISRIVTLISAMTAEDLLRNSIFEAILYAPFPETILKTFLSILNNSTINLATIQLTTFRMSELDGNLVGIELSPIKFLCEIFNPRYSAVSSYPYTEEQFKATMALLIYAGFDPSDAINSNFVPKKHVQFVKETYDDYREGVKKALADGLPLFSLDIVGLTASYCLFAPPALSASSTSHTPSEASPAPKS